MNRGWHRQKINPVEWLDGRVNGDITPFITFDPNLRGSDRDYWIIRQCSHDGTLLFIQDLIEKTLSPIVSKESCHRDFQPPEGEDVHYTIGWLKLSTVYGRVDLPIGRYPGQRDRARLAVKVRVTPPPTKEK